MARVFYLLLVLLGFSLSCADDEENSSVVGTWNIVSHRQETTRNSQVINDVTYRETGVMRFNNDGTGYLDLDVEVLGLPMETDLTWNYDSLGFVFVNYQDGRPTRRYDPSYRGTFTLLTGSEVRGTIGNFQVVNNEILLRRQ